MTLGRWSASRTAACDILICRPTHILWERELADVLFITARRVDKPKDGDRRAAWVLLTINPEGEVGVETRHVAYEIVSIAKGIRAAAELPEHVAIDIETGGGLR